MSYWRLADSEAISRDNVELTENFFLSYLEISAKKNVWKSNLLIYQPPYQPRRLPFSAWCPSRSHKNPKQNCSKKLHVCLCLHDPSINQTLKGLAKKLKKSTLGYINVLQKWNKHFFGIHIVSLIFCIIPYVCSKICNEHCSVMCHMQTRSS